MKKILLALAVVALGFTANAQFSLHVGYANSMLHSTYEAYGASDSETDNFSGFYLGGTYYYNIQNHFGLECGINAIFTTGDETNKLALNIPIEASYRIPLNSDLSLTVLAGPSIDFGLLWKDTEDDVSLYDSDGLDAKRFNIMLQAGLRLNYNQWGLNLTYQYGLLNLVDFDYAQVNVKVKESRLLVGLSYAF